MGFLEIACIQPIKMSDLESSSSQIISAYQLYGYPDWKFTIQHLPRYYLLLAFYWNDRKILYHLPPQ